MTAAMPDAEETRDVREAREARQAILAVATPGDRALLELRPTWRAKLRARGLELPRCESILDEFAAAVRLLHEHRPRLTREEWILFEGVPAWEIEGEQIEAEARQTAEELDRVAVEARAWLADRRGEPLTPPDPAALAEEPWRLAEEWRVFFLRHGEEWLEEFDFAREVLAGQGAAGNDVDHRAAAKVLELLARVPQEARPAAPRDAICSDHEQPSARCVGAGHTEEGS